MALRFFSNGDLDDNLSVILSSKIDDDGGGCAFKGKAHRDEIIPKAPSLNTTRDILMHILIESPLAAELACSPTPFLSR